MCDIKVKDRIPSKELRERLELDDIISGQLSIIPSARWGMSTSQGAMLCSLEHCNRPDIARAMHYRLCDTATYGHSGLSKENDHPAYTTDFSFKP